MSTAGIPPEEIASEKVEVLLWFKRDADFNKTDDGYSIHLSQEERLQFAVDRMSVQRRKRPRVADRIYPSDQDFSSLVSEPLYRQVLEARLRGERGIIFKGLFNGPRLY